MHGQRADAGFVEALVATSDIAKGTTGSEALQAGLVKKAKATCAACGG